MEMPSFSHLISASLGGREKKRIHYLLATLIGIARICAAGGSTQVEQTKLAVFLFSPLFRTQSSALIESLSHTTTEVGREQQCQRLAKKKNRERDQLGTLWHMSAQPGNPFQYCIVRVCLATKQDPFIFPCRLRSSFESPTHNYTRIASPHAPNPFYSQKREKKTKLRP